MDENEFWALIDRSREELEAVAEVAEGDVEAEGLRYAVLEAYEATYDLYPRLAEKFG